MRWIKSEMSKSKAHFVRSDSSIHAHRPGNTELNFVVIAESHEILERVKKS